MDQYLDLILQQWAVIENAAPLIRKIFYLAAAGFIFGLLSLLRSLRKDKPGHVNRLAGSVDALKVKVADVGSRSDSFSTEVLEELRKVEHKLSQLESQVSALNQGSSKKKTNLAEQEPSGALAASPGTAPKLEQLQEQLRESTSDLLQSTDNLEQATFSSGLEKTRSHFFSRFRGLVQGGKGISPEQFEDLEELLLESDLGVQTSSLLLAKVKNSINGSGVCTEEQLKTILRSELEAILKDRTHSEFDFDENPLVIFVVGVNGVGKTTTIGKLAHKFSSEGRKVLLGACDTFRAAAGEQLSVWAERSNVAIEQAEGEEKPSTVAFRAINRAINQHYDVLIIDTAGRLHTKQNLMKELEAVKALVGRERAGAPHETLLVLDASTGQNALQQAREFNQSVDLSGLIVTKLDGTPKGGIVVAIKEELGLPIRYIGVGEGEKDLQEFSSKDFVTALLEETSTEPVKLEKTSEHAKVRRKRRRQAL